MSVPLSDTRLTEIRERARRMVADKVTFASIQYAEDYSLLLAEVERLRTEAEQRRVELRDRRTEDLNLRGLLAPDGLPRRVPMELGASLVPAVDRLLLELDRFRDGHRSLFALMQDGQHWDGQRLVSEALLSQRDIRRALHWPAPVAPHGSCECKATSDDSPIHEADAATTTSKEQQR